MWHLYSHIDTHGCYRNHKFVWADEQVKHHNSMCERTCTSHFRVTKYLPQGTKKPIKVVFFTFWDQEESWEKREGGRRSGLRLRHPSSLLALIFILPLWPLTFQLSSYKKNRMQSEMACDIQRDWDWSNMVVSRQLKGKDRLTERWVSILYIIHRQNYASSMHPALSNLWHLYGCKLQLVSI